MVWGATMQSMGIVKDWLMMNFRLGVKEGVEHHHHGWNICFVIKMGE